MKRIFSLLLFLCFTTVSIAQETARPYVFSNFENIVINTEFRPRFEFRDGYPNLSFASDQPSYHINQRSRINADFKAEKLRFYTSIQDVRIWGEENTRATTGGLMVFETYIEPSIGKKSRLRIGRQVITLDAERLFARNDWRATGGKHDAIRHFYQSKGFEMQTAFAYNQNNAALNSGVFDPGFESYLFLGLNHIKTTVFKNRLEIRLLNFVDAYQNPINGAIYAKANTGGTFTYDFGPIKTKVEGYYQFGHINTGQQLTAYFLNPEVKTDLSRYELALGAEFLSGTSNTIAGGISRSFLAQYGAFHQHNGRMDYTAKTVRTYNHEGIGDLYFKQKYKLKSKFELGFETHAFATTSKQVDVSNKELSPFWGFECDARLIWKPNYYTAIEFAYMAMKATETRAALYGGNSNIIQQFAYIQAKFTPILWSYHKNGVEIQEIQITKDQ
jgi:hypothetical protein